MSANGKPYRTAPLDSLVAISGGGTPSKRVPEYYAGDIPWVTPKDMKSWFIDDAQDHITEKAISESSTNLVEPGAVLVCIRSGVLAHTLPVAINRVAVALNQDMKAFRCADGLHAPYLARFLKWYSPKLLRTVRGTTAHNLSMDVVKRLEIPLPPLSEQKRIADILDKADGIRRKRQAARAIIDEITHAAFLAMVGPSAPNYSTWPVRELEQLASDEKGSMRTGPFGSDLRHSEFVDDGVAVLGIDNAVQNRFAWEERRYITHDKYERLRRYTVCPGDVLITIMATLGRSSVVPDDIPLAINTKHLACITLDREKAEPEFISNAIHRHPYILGQLGVRGRGAIMDGLNLGIIRELKIPVPPIEVQRMFNQTLGKLRTFESKVCQAEIDAEQLFNALVQRAFKGELCAI